MLRTLSAFLLLLLLQASAFSEPRGGDPVAFESTNVRGGTSVIRGLLFRSKSAPRGAVVLLHGSAGWSDSPEGHYARALSAAGYAVLAIDSYGPRGISGTTDDQSRISGGQLTLDAFAARRYLVGEGFDPKKMVLMGFSKGGQATMYAADRTFYPSEQERFDVVIPVYPGCNSRPREPKPASSMFMVLGEKDDYTGVQPCKDLAEDYARAGGRVVVKIYPGAAHAFDGNSANTVITRMPWAENYSECVFFIEPNGDRTYNGRTFPPGDQSIFVETRRTCMKKGATVWTNLNQKAQATADVIAFLSIAFP